MKFVSVLLLVTFLVAATQVSVNGEDTAAADKTINILIMVPWPDARNTSITGWDAGLALLTAGRVAVKEINERGTILNGYRLNFTVAAHEPCAFTESMESLTNLVHYAISPGRKVAAVLGLYCSTSTVFLSQIAGFKDVDLLQLSAANSPIFSVESDRFPRLLRFLQSAAVFSNTVYELMEKYDWTRIGLVQDLKSVFYVGMAQSFVQLLRNDGKTLEYHGGLVETNFIDETLQEIRDAEVRIIYLTATETQIVSLVCAAYKAGMRYPNYVWIIADYRIEQLVKQKPKNECDVYKALEGSIMMYLNLVLASDSIIESSNITYRQYSEEYDEELELVRKDYQWLLNQTGDKLEADKEYGGVLYDQVWAFALALKKALPILESKNLDIENYGYGQTEITDILEESLFQVEFRGVSGYISFTEEGEVGTRVQLYQTITNYSNNNTIGSCRIVPESKEFSCDSVELKRADFDDIIPSISVAFPLVLSLVILVIVSSVIAVITFVLILLLYYRHRPEVKATSPVLSVMMFCGCYFLCFAAILHTISVTFTTSNSNLLFALVCNVDLFLGVNGCNLLFVTLFIKLFRISQIFNNQNLTTLGWIYTNKSLLVIALILCTLPDFILIIMFGYDPMVRQQSRVYRVDSGVLQYDVYNYCASSKYPLMWLCLVFGYLSIFIACIVYLAITTRNIQNEHFKDTKKVNAFIFFTVLSFGVPFPCGIFLLYASNGYFIGNTIIVFGFLLLASLSQIMLFMPKVIPILFGVRTTKSIKSRWSRSSFAKSFIRHSSFLF